MKNYVAPLLEILCNCYEDALMASGYSDFNEQWANNPFLGEGDD